MLFIILHSSKNSTFKDFPSSRECLWQETRKEPDLQKDSRPGPRGALAPLGSERKRPGAVRSQQVGAGEALALPHLTSAHTDGHTRFAT